MQILTYVDLANLTGSTGAGRMARQMIEHLHALPETDIHLLLPRDNGKAAADRIGAPWNSLPIHTIDATRKTLEKMWWLTQRPLAERYLREVNVVYSPNESFVPTKTGYSVATIHDAAQLESDIYPRSSRWWATRAKKYAKCRMVASKADVIHTHSAFAANRLSHFFPTISPKLRIIPLGVAPHFRLPPTSDGIRFLMEREIYSKPYILLPGGLNQRKNAALVLQVWPTVKADNPDILLVVAGHSEEIYAARAHSQPTILQLGYVPDEALTALYHHALAVWFPSRYEGFGLPAIEAMACGAALVASTGTAVEEVVGDAALLLSKDDVAGHSSALRTLLVDDQTRRNLQVEGRKRVATFTWEHAAAQLRIAMQP